MLHVSPLHNRDLSHRLILIFFTAYRQVWNVLLYFLIKATGGSCSFLFRFHLVSYTCLPLPSLSPFPLPTPRLNLTYISSLHMFLSSPPPYFKFLFPARRRLCITFCTDLLIPFHETFNNPISLVINVLGTPLVLNSSPMMRRRTLTTRR
jgi:hypothetical protein